jgi:hypothetical protein
MPVMGWIFFRHGGRNVHVSEGMGRRECETGLIPWSSSEGFVTITRRLHAATDRPTWIKANAGLPEIIHDRAAYAQTPDKFAKVVPDLIAAGASFIGGCCGTTPEFIRAVKRAGYTNLVRNSGVHRALSPPLGASGSQTDAL